MRLFARTPVFKDAPPAFLSAFASTLTVECALKGDLLAREGEALERVYFIESGNVEVRTSHIGISTPVPTPSAPH